MFGTGTTPREIHRYRASDGTRVPGVSMVSDLADYLAGVWTGRTRYVAIAGGGSTGGLASTPLTCP